MATEAAQCHGHRQPLAAAVYTHHDPTTADSAAADNVDFQNFLQLSVLLFIAFWGVGGLFAVLDLTRRPRRLYNGCRIQKDTPPPSAVQYARLALWVLLIQSFVATPLFYVFVVHVLPWRRALHASSISSITGGDSSSSSSSSGSWTGRYTGAAVSVLLSLPAFVLLEDVSFYACHRLLHNRRLYRPIHKMHHTYKAPVAIAALYAHPIEVVLSSLAPLMLGPFVLGSPAAVYTAWFVLGTLTTLCSHSGYELPLLPSPRFHDDHHRLFNGNYGVDVLGIDKLLGTGIEVQQDRSTNGAADCTVMMKTRLRKIPSGSGPSDSVSLRHRGLQSVT